MARHRPSRAATVLALLGALPAAAAEHTRVEPLWLAPAARVSQEVLALLSLPPGWMAGDAAVLIVGDRPGLRDARDRLVAALLDENAAVLELDVHTTQSVSPDSAAASAPPAPEDLLPGLFAALLALRRDAGAGVVVALGHGAGERAALLAVNEAVAAKHLDPAEPRFAAAAALGPGRPTFAAGAAPPSEAAWPARARLLCARLGALASLSSAAASRGCDVASAGAAERDCVAALALSAASPAWAPTPDPGQER